MNWGRVLPLFLVRAVLAGGAATGTLMGAALGAAIGAASGNAGAGAAIGAGSGLLIGTAAASDPACAAAGEIQRRYDMAYQQCMYAKGSHIPGVIRTPPRAYRVLRPPPAFALGPPPPPPPTAYPPPPPRLQ
jgi:hypothetical protein